MDYTRYKNLGKKLLTKFGRVEGCVLLVDAGKSEWDGKELLDRKSYESHDGIGVRLAYSAESIGDMSTIIQAGDVRILCQFDVEPTADRDMIMFGSDYYNIVSVDTIAPDAGIVPLYKAQCRRTRNGE